MNSSSKQVNNIIEDKAMQLFINTCKHLFDEDPDLKTKTWNIITCLREPAHTPYERRELMWNSVIKYCTERNNVN